MLKEEENPPLVFPEDKTIKQFAGTWWVAHTRSRNEKAVAWSMLGKQIQYFLPMSWKVRRKNNRTIRSLLPLFASYVFFCGDENDRLEVLKTNRIATIIPVVDQAKLVEQLAPIEKALRSGKTLMPHEYIKIGQKCKVIAGPLMGSEGMVIRQGDKGLRLVLSVEMLGQAASVEISSEMIEPVEQ
jgi:transcriptional antiterminator NusG